MKQTTSNHLNDEKVEGFPTRSRISSASALVIAALVCCSIWGFVSRTHSRASETTALAPLEVTANLGPTAQAPAGPLAPVELVQFALYDVGIYPRQIHATQSNVEICFEDLSGGANHLIVQSETGGAPVGAVLRTGPAARGRNDFRLLPGRYSVFMADHPEIVSTLIVGPLIEPRRAGK